MVLREEFDARLWQAAADAGAQLHDGEAVRAISAEGLVRTDKGRYQGRVVVGADGSEGLVPRAVGLRHPPQRYMVAVHVEAPFPAWNRRESALLDFSIPRGYAWVFPKGDLYNVGACTTGKAVGLKKSLEAFLRQEGLGDQPALHYHARRIPLGGKARPLHRGRVLLVGDAAGLADPLLGEGIAYALMSAQMAATAIIEYLEGRAEGLAGYSQRVQDTLHRDLRALALIAAFVYRFPRLALRLLRASPRLQRRAVGIISGEGSPSGAWP
jgi:flavin-dependent dehydrogenase